MSNLHNKLHSINDLQKITQQHEKVREGISGPDPIGFQDTITRPFPSTKLDLGANISPSGLRSVILWSLLFNYKFNPMTYMTMFLSVCAIIHGLRSNFRPDRILGATKTPSTQAIITEGPCSEHHALTEPKICKVGP
jgi:hypothetical protein